MENLRLVRGGALETKKVKWGKPEDVITIEDGVVKFLYAPKGIISMFFRNIFKKYAAKNPITVYEFGLNIKDVLYSELILKKFYCFGDGATSVSIKLKGFDKAQVKEFSKLVDENKSEEFAEAPCYKKRGFKMWWNNLIYKQRDVIYMGEERAFAKQYRLPAIPIPLFAKGAIYASAVTYADAVFNDMQGGFFGKKGVSFGYRTSIFFGNLATGDAKKINQFVKERAVKLQGDGKKYKVWTLKFWIKEQVQVNDDSIIHVYKKWYNVRTTYLSYEEMDAFYISKSGFLKRQLYTSGEVSFQMNGSFWWFQMKPIRNKLKEVLKEKLDEKGQVFRPSIFSGQRSKYSLFVAKNIIIGQTFEKKGLTKDVKVKVFKNCNDFAVRPLWSLCKRELMLNGDVPVDLRTKGQVDMMNGLSALTDDVEVKDNDVNLVSEASFWMPGIWFFWGRLCNALKGAGGTKKPMKIKYWKKANFEDM
ncbi:MAG: hypothetical protein MJ162_05445 [Treponema sp.]|nr:hypothetical protein [Treponema sp.]